MFLKACKSNVAQPFKATTFAESVGKKRSLETNEGTDEPMRENVKKACSSDGAPVPHSAPPVDVEKILNFPLPSSESVGCILKMYCDEELILNDVIEVVGIISFDTPRGEAMDTDEPSEFNPPSSLIPRIHCLLKKSWLHNNPHLPPTEQHWSEGLLPCSSVFIIYFKK